MSSVMLISLCN